MRLSRRLVDDNHPVHALLDHFCILLHTSSPSSAPLALHRWLDAAVNVPSPPTSPTPAPPHPRMAGASACVRHAVGLLASRMLLHLSRLYQLLSSPLVTL